MSGYLDWKVGDKVVCVDDSDAGTLQKPRKLLQRGAIYTIRKITTGYGEYRGKISDHVIVALNEVANKVAWGEDGFAAARFHPVQTRKTDISIFTAMLKPSKVEA